MFNNFTFNCLKMFSSHLCRLIMATIVMFGFKILKLKMCYVFDETEKIKKHGFFNIWDKWKCIFFVFISNREYLLEMVKKKKFTERICLQTCFKLWPMKNIFSSKSYIMTCLQSYWEQLLFVTFLWVHSSSKEVSYLFQQN